MLSIIISSYQPKLYDQLIENISMTIGEEFNYEIIKIWNPNLMGITKAYNIGAAKSKFENLLFVHEDVIFHTTNWGEKLLSHLNQKNAGIVGVAGSSYVPRAPSSWTVLDKYNFVNIIQSDKTHSNSVRINSIKENRTKVFAIDGVFLAVKKEVFNQIKFDENLLKSFHGYDLDLSLSTSRLYQNYVVNDILIEHFSNGNKNCDWLIANMIVKEKHKHKFQETINPEAEKIAYLGFIQKYFSCFPINFENVVFSLNFYPINMKFTDHIFIIKKYYNYIKYSASINKKLESSD